ncbi:unnamed protein product [Ixodes persulcatus]
MASPDAATGALLPENLSVSGVVLPPPPPYLSASDSRGSSSPSTHDLPPPLPPAFNAAALCDQFCSVINGFRGLDPLSNARLKSPSSRSVAADATDCRLIQYRGEKIAAFAYRGEYLLCLPQAFELFLRHLVGGLHTVYTKLKRLGISPIVCNVEQVRVLRGLGAIQPGVNRCKLLSCKDFDALYKDCTTARPGRPPKRASLVGLGGRSGGYPPLLKPGAEMDYEAAVKSAPVSEKMAQSAYHAAALGCSPLDPQALGMLGLGGHGAGNSAAAAAAAAAYQRHLLSGGLALPLASIAHLGRGQERLLRQQAAGMDLCNPRWAYFRRTTLRHYVMNGSRGKKKTTSTYLYGICERQRFYGSNFRVQNIGLPVTLAENYNPLCSHLFFSVAETVTTPARKTSRATPTQTASPKVPDVRPPGDAETGSVLNLSQNGGGTRARDVDVFRTRDDDDGQGESDYAEDRDQGAFAYPKRHRAPSQDGDSQLQQFMDRTGLLAARGSVETLLQNILGLLKVAEENARQQEQQVHMERAELKVEILRERELREGLEKKLQEEQNKRVFYQKRLRREKRCRRQVQDQLEGEVKKRVRYEEALRTTLAESQIPKETLQEEIKSEDAVAMESDNSIKSMSPSPQAYGHWSHNANGFPLSPLTG